MRRAIKCVVVMAIIFVPLFITHINTLSMLQNSAATQWSSGFWIPKGAVVTTDYKAYQEFCNRPHVNTIDNSLGAKFKDFNFDEAIVFVTPPGSTDSPFPILYAGRLGNGQILVKGNGSFTNPKSSASEYASDTFTVKDGVASAQIERSWGAIVVLSLLLLIIASIVWGVLLAIGWKAWKGIRDFLAERRERKRWNEKYAATQ